MNEQEPLLTIRFDGPAVSAGRIPVAHLLRFLSHLERALQRTGRVLLGASSSVARGAPNRDLKEEAALDLTLLTHGSSAAVIGLDRPARAQTSVPGEDFGQTILETALQGLAEVQQPGDSSLPSGFDAGVLMAWRDAGGILEQGVDNIAMRLRTAAAPIEIRYTASGRARLKQRLEEPTPTTRQVEGRLLMADFKELDSRCRVHPSIGKPILCHFDEPLREDVLDNLLRFVRVVGEAMEDASGEVASIRIQSIERIEGHDDETGAAAWNGSDSTQDFWEPATIDTLARAQGVQPLADPTVLFGTWPDEADDGCEGAVVSMRHESVAGDPRP